MKQDITYGENILSMVKQYRKILTIKFGSIVKICQFAKFSPLPIFVLRRQKFKAQLNISDITSKSGDSIIRNYVHCMCCQ